MMWNKTIDKNAVKHIPRLSSCAVGDSSLGNFTCADWEFMVSSRGENKVVNMTKKQVPNHFRFSHNMVSQPPESPYTRRNIVIF